MKNQILKVQTSEQTLFFLCKSSGNYCYNPTRTTWVRTQLDLSWFSDLWDVFEAENPYEIIKEHGSKIESGKDEAGLKCLAEYIKIWGFHLNLQIEITELEGSSCEYYVYFKFAKENSYFTGVYDTHLLNSEEWFENFHVKEEMKIFPRYDDQKGGSIRWIGHGFGKTLELALENYHARINQSSDLMMGYIKRKDGLFLRNDKLQWAHYWNGFVWHGNRGSAKIQALSLGLSEDDWEFVVDWDSHLAPCPR